MLLQPGSKDGVVKVIRENGAGVAYSWSAARCGAQNVAVLRYVARHWFYMKERENMWRLLQV